MMICYIKRGSILIGLIGSLAFGSTAIVTLSSLGGSSPLLYVFFSFLFLASITLRRHVWRDLAAVLTTIRMSWVVCILLIYVAIGAVLFPRLFAGYTNVFVVSRVRKGVFEVPLMPVSGNISQTGYFILGGLCCLGVCMMLVRKRNFDDIRRGFFLWSGLHIAMGLIDLGSKLVGLGDILMPIRTASYAMITEAEQAGFARIVGGYSEASTFGGVSLACLAFTYTYWRKTKSLQAFVMTGILLVLLLLSTSSTAYVGLVIICIPVGISLVRAYLSGRFKSEDILILTFFILAIVVILGIGLYSPHSFDPVVRLFDTAIVNKSSSESGQERAYWNYKSLEAFIDTGGFGVGLGSSRASSWPVAVLSQLGIIGVVLITALLGVLVRGLSGLQSQLDPETGAIVSSVRACSLAGIVSASIAGGSADPGVVFFIAIAAIASARSIAQKNTVRRAYRSASLAPHTV